MEVLRLEVKEGLEDLKLQPIIRLVNDEAVAEAIELTNMAIKMALSGSGDHNDTKSTGWRIIPPDSAGLTLLAPLSRPCSALLWRAVRRRVCPDCAQQTQRVHSATVL